MKLQMNNGASSSLGCLWDLICHACHACLICHALEMNLLLYVFRAEFPEILMVTRSNQNISFTLFSLEYGQ